MSKPINFGFLEELDPEEALKILTKEIQKIQEITNQDIPVSETGVVMPGEAFPDVYTPPESMDYETGLVDDTALSLNYESKEKFDRNKRYTENMDALNQLVSKHSDIAEQYFQGFIPKVNDEPINPIPEERKTVPDNITNARDLINSYKSHFPPGTSDGQIIRSLKQSNPEIIAAIYQSQREKKSGKTVHSTDPIASQSIDEFYQNELEIMHHNFKIQNMYNTPAFILQHFDDESGKFDTSLLGRDRDVDIAKELKSNPLYKDYTDEQIGAEIERMKVDATYRDNLVGSWIKAGAAETEKFYKENPDLQAHMAYYNVHEWLEKEGGAGMSRKLQHELLKSAPSVIENLGFTSLVGAGVSLATPNKAIKAASMILASSGHSYLKEGADYMSQSYLQLTTPQLITNEEYNRIIQDAYADYKPHAKNANHLEELVSNYISSNYEQKNGNIVTVPISPEDALKAIELSAKTYGAGSMLIETFSFGLANKIPGMNTLKSRMLFTFKPMNASLNAINKTIRQAPGIRHAANLKALAGKKITQIPLFETISRSPHLARITTLSSVNSFGEMFEEVAQSHYELATRIYGPLNPFEPMKGFQEELKHDHTASWKNYNWKAAILEPAIGGWGGGKIGDVIGFSQDLTGMNNWRYNKDINNQFTKNLNDGLVVKKDGMNRYSLHQRTSYIDDKTGDILYDDRPAVLSNLEEGSLPVPTTDYTTLEEANQVATVYNALNRKRGELTLATKNKWLKDAEAKIEKNEEGGYDVNVYTNGSLTKVLGTYSKRSKARKKLANINNAIDKVTTILNTTSQDKIDTQNKINEKIVDNIDTDESIGENLELSDKGGLKNKKSARWLIKGWLQGYKNPNTGTKIKVDTKNELYQELDDAGMYDNPDILLNTLIENKEILSEEDIDPQDVIKDFKDSWMGNVDLMDDMVKQLEDNLLKGEDYENDTGIDYTNIGADEFTYDQGEDTFVDDLADTGSATGADFGALEDTVEETVVEEKAPEEVDGYIKVKKTAAHDLAETPEAQQLDYIENVLHPEGKPELFEEGYVWEKAPEKPISVKQYIPKDKEAPESTSPEAELSKDSMELLERFYEKDKIVSKIKETSDSKLSFYAGEIRVAIEKARKLGKLDTVKNLTNDLTAIESEITNRKEAPKKPVKKAPEITKKETKVETDDGIQWTEGEATDTKFWLDSPAVTGLVVMHNGKEAIVRKINAAGKVQLVDRETGKNLPGTPDKKTVLANNNPDAVDMLEQILFKGRIYYIDNNGRVYNLEAGTVINDQDMVKEIKAAALATMHELDTEADIVENLDEATPELNKLPGPTEKPTMRYAGIGSRSTPAIVQEAMTSVAEWLQNQGYILRSGGAKGADQAFEKAVYEGQDKKEIFLASDADISESNKDKTNLENKKIAHEIVKETHPNYSALKKKAGEYGLNLMARNTFQIFGENLDTPVDFVIAWTPGGKLVGGTAQAIRIANAKGIKVFNVGAYKDVDDFRRDFYNWYTKQGHTMDSGIERAIPDKLIPEREDILKSRTGELPVKNFKYTDDQKNALSLVAKFLDKKTDENTPSKDRIFVLEGFAGTGKTTIVDNIITYAHMSKFPAKAVQIMALTNQAVNVLRAKMPKIYNRETRVTADFSTLQKGLYEENSDAPSGWAPKEPKRYDANTLFVVDEASMLGDDTIKMISKILSKGGKVIYLGDSAQLPPLEKIAKWIFGVKKKIRQPISPLFKRSNYKMTQVMRQGLKSHILKFVTALRTPGVDGKLNFFMPTESSGDVEVREDDDFLNQWKKRLLEGVDTVRMVVFSNVKRMSYNRQARATLFGRKAADFTEENAYMTNEQGFYIPGDNERNILLEGEQVIAADNTPFRPNSHIFTINRPVLIGSFIYKLKEGQGAKFDPDENKNPYRKVYIYRDADPEITPMRELAEEDDGENKFKNVFFLQPELAEPSHDIPITDDQIVVGKDLFKRHAEKILVSDGPGLPQKTVFRTHFNIQNITYGYAATAHKAQGSQWNTVYVDADVALWAQGQGVSSVSKMLKLQEGQELQKEYYEGAARWLYTAVTRAEKSLVLKRLKGGQSAARDWDTITNIAKSQTKEGKQFQIKPPVKKTKKEKDKIQSLGEALTNKFEGKVKFIPVDNELLYDDFGKPVIAYYDKKEKAVIVNLAFADTDAPFHEFSHPFFNEMEITNPALFNKLAKDVLDTKAGKDKFKFILEAYDIGDINTVISEINALLRRTKTGDIQELSAEKIYNVLNKYDTDNKVTHELLAYMTGELAVENIPETNRLRKFINNVMEWIKAKLFGANWSSNIYARAMDMDTTINDIARLMANSDRQFTLEGYDANLVKENYDFKPNNRYQFMAWFKKKSEVSLADLKVLDKQWLEMFWNGAWDEARGAGLTKKEDFSKAVMDSVPHELHNSFDIWYRAKFKKKKPFGDNSNFIPFKDVYSAVKDYATINEERMLQAAGRKGTNEKELNTNSLLYMKDFGLTLSTAQLNKLYRFARRTESYGEWKELIIEELNLPKDIIGWKNDGLKRFHKQIKSTRLQNRGNSTDQIINHELLISDKGFTLSRKSPEKRFRARKFDHITGVYENLETSSNSGFGKATVYDINNPGDNTFEWLSGSDIKQSKVELDEFKMPILDREGLPVVNTNKLFGFLNKDTLIDLDAYLIDKHNRTIAFSRGDSDKIAIVELLQEDKDNVSTSKSAIEWLRREEADGYITKSQANMIFNSLKKLSSIKQRAAIAATHRALKKVWPTYAVEGGGGPNVYKRLKIPFTPATFDDQMAPLTGFKFNPKDVMFQFKDGEPFSPLKKVKGKIQYIGDGETITSKGAFQKFYESHGLKKGTAIAKTIHYFVNGDKTFALKHQHFMAVPGFKILNKKGDILFEVSDKGSIHLAPAHPDYKEGEDNYVDFLGTSDEMKIGTKEGIGNLFENSDKIIVPGGSVGFIKYEESMESHAKHAMQWWNHISDPAMIKYFEDNYVPQLNDKIQKAIRVAIDSDTSTSADKIANLLEVMQGKEGVGMIPALLELVRLGAGGHRQIRQTVDKLVQSKLIDPAMKLDGNDGSTYNVAMDITNTLERDKQEVAISRDGATHVLEAFRKAEGYKNLAEVKKVDTDVINKWLAENPVYGMLTRFPVPHEGGAIMARIKFLHDRKGVVMMHVKDVKHRIEGDNDGDHVVIEFLPNQEMTEAFVNHLNNLEIRSQDLEDFVKDDVKSNMWSMEAKADLISKLTLGQRAIGEIANIQAAYGSIRNIYKSLKSIEGGKKIIVKSPEDKVTFNVYYNKKNQWTGNVGDFLRLYLQAAVDNGKYGLLGEWNYSRKNVIKQLFSYEDKSSLNDSDMSLISGLFDIHIQANRIRNGQTYDKGRFSFSDTLTMSKQYHDYIKDRAGTLINIGLRPEMVDNPIIAPIEHVAMMPAQAYFEIENKYGAFFGIEDSPFVIKQTLHEVSHVLAMNVMNSNKADQIAKAMMEDGKNPQDNDYLQGEIVEANVYRDKMGTKFDSIRNSLGEMGPQSLDFNDKLITFKEQYHKEFSNLSKTAQIWATYGFLDGHFNIEKDKQESFYAFAIPPVSDKAGQASLLSPRIIKQYYKLFNSNIKSRLTWKTAESKVRIQRNYSGMNTILRELGCK